MENRKFFTTPTCEVIRFAVQDVVATSGWNTSIDYFDIPDVNSATD